MQIPFKNNDYCFWIPKCCVLNTIFFLIFLLFIFVVLYFCISLFFDFTISVFFNFSVSLFLYFCIFVFSLLSSLLRTNIYSTKTHSEPINCYSVYVLYRTMAGFQGLLNYGRVPRATELWPGSKGSKGGWGSQEGSTMCSWNFKKEWRKRS